MATHVWIPAWSEPLNNRPATSQTIAVDNVTAARLLIELGDWAHARMILEASTASDPSNPEAWFLLGMARRGGGDERAAADAFRHAIKLQPSSPRPYLELGRSLTEIKEFDDAKKAFDQGLALADNRVVRRNIRNYLKIIEQNRELNFSIAARVQPDTNPAASSGQKVVNIGGIPFVLNSPPSNKSAFGAGITTAIRYAPWITDETRMVGEIGYSGIHFLHACCSDDNFSAAVGPSFQIQNFEITPQAYYRYRLYDGRAYSEEEGLRLGTAYHQSSYQLGVGAEAGKARLLEIQLPGTVARGYASADLAVFRSFSVGTTIRYERDNYPIPSQAFSAPSIELRSSFLGPWDLPASMWTTFLYRDYDGATLTSSGVRIDRYWSFGISVELDFLNIWGMSPSVGLAYETESSTDQLGRFDRVRVLVGIGKVF
jgi:tetratricopeptide (TPR) repeat protein